MTPPQPAALPEQVWLMYAKKKPSLRRLSFVNDLSSQEKASGWVSEPYALAALQSQPAAAGVSDDEREAFEAWATSCWHDTSKYEGLYKSVQTHALWCAWETRAILALRPQAVPMTEDQAAKIMFDLNDRHTQGTRCWGWIDVIRSVERFHLIGITAQGAQGEQG